MCKKKLGPMIKEIEKDYQNDPENIMKITNSINNFRSWQR